MLVAGARIPVLYRQEILFRSRHGLSLERSKKRAKGFDRSKNRVAFRSGRQGEQGITGGFLCSASLHSDQTSSKKDWTCGKRWLRRIEIHCLFRAAQFAG